MRLKCRLQHYHNFICFKDERIVYKLWLLVNCTTLLSRAFINISICCIFNMENHFDNDMTILVIWPRCQRVKILWFYKLYTYNVAVYCDDVDYIEYMGLRTIGPTPFVDFFTVSMHSANSRHLPAVRAVQGDCQWPLKTMAIPIGHVSSQSIAAEATPTYV